MTVHRTHNDHLLLIDECIDIILNTRDFCGNEKEAVGEYLIEEYGIRDLGQIQKIYRAANYQANAQWNADQRSAGVPEKYLF